MSPDYTKELEQAAALTKRLVDALVWMERKGPSAQALEFRARDITKLAADLTVAVDPNTDIRKYGKEIDRLRSILCTVKMLRNHLTQTSEELYLRICVLDALERVGPNAVTDEEEGE